GLLLLLEREVDEAERVVGRGVVVVDGAGVLENHLRELVLAFLEVDLREQLHGAHVALVGLEHLLRLVGGGLVLALLHQRVDERGAQAEGGGVLRDLHAQLGFDGAALLLAAEQAGQRVPRGVLAGVDVGGLAVVLLGAREVALALGDHAEIGDGVGGGAVARVGGLELGLGGGEVALVGGVDAAAEGALRLGVVDVLRRRSRLGVLGHLLGAAALGGSGRRLVAGLLRRSGLLHGDVGGAGLGLVGDLGGLAGGGGGGGGLRGRGGRGAELAREGREQRKAQQGPQPEAAAVPGADPDPEAGPGPGFSAQAAHFSSPLSFWAASPGLGLPSGVSTTPSPNRFSLARAPLGSLSTGYSLGRKRLSDSSVFLVHSFEMCTFLA